MRRPSLWFYLLQALITLSILEKSLSRVITLTMLLAEVHGNRTSRECLLDPAEGQ